MRDPNPDEPPDRGETPAHQVVVKALKERGDINDNSGDWALYDDIDPDALDRLFTHEGNETLSVTFEVEGATVTVWKDGEVHAKVE